VNKAIWSKFPEPCSNVLLTRSPMRHSPSRWIKSNQEHVHYRKPEWLPANR
jgi:hypothetical protein